MVVMVENEQVTGRLPSRGGPLRERLGAGEIPSTSSEYEREDSGVRNLVNTADRRRERENQRPYHDASINGNGAGPGYDYGSNSRYQPPQLDGEAGRAYTQFLRSQQQPNGSQTPTPASNQNAYSHRMNEGHYQQSPQPGQTRGEQQPIGPGKVESEGEDEGMMGQGKGTEMNGFVDGLGSPRLRGGALHRG